MIIEHATLTWEDKYGTPHPCHVVQCDFCRKNQGPPKEDIGEAAEAARKKGYMTVKGRRSGQPLKWQCKTCRVSAAAATTAQPRLRA